MHRDISTHFSAQRCIVDANLLDIADIKAHKRKRARGHTHIERARVRERGKLIKRERVHPCVWAVLSMRTCYQKGLQLCHLSDLASVCHYAQQKQLPMNDLLW